MFAILLSLWEAISGTREVLLIVFFFISFYPYTPLLFPSPIWATCSVFCVSLFFFFKILLMRETEDESGRDMVTGESDKQTPCWARSPIWGTISQPWDHELSQNQELDASPNAPPRCPLNPHFFVIACLDLQSEVCPPSSKLTLPRLVVVCSYVPF